MKSFAATLLISGAAASKPSVYAKGLGASADNDDGAENILGAPKLITCADGTKVKCNAGTLGCTDNGSLCPASTSRVGVPKLITCANGI